MLEKEREERDERDDVEGDTNVGGVDIKEGSGSS